MMLPHSEMLHWLHPMIADVEELPPLSAEELADQGLQKLIADALYEGGLDEEAVCPFDPNLFDKLLVNKPVETLLIRDMMWYTSKNEPQSVKPLIDIEKEMEEELLMLPKDFFGDCSTTEPESANLVNNNSSYMSVAPYTPDDDHSYNKPQCEEVKEIKIKREPVDERSDSDSDSSGDDDDDEVDIETVSDDGQKVCAIKFQRTMRPIIKPKRFSQRENTPPVKLKSEFKQEATKAVSAVFKRTKSYQQKSYSRTVVRTKRGRRPINSLSCSPASSRSNSDNEEPPPKRSMHNNMERMRRNQQRMALHCLRDRIPELKHNPKVSKVKIINKAQEYIEFLLQQDQEQEEQIRRLRDRQMILRKRLEMCKPKH